MERRGNHEVPSAVAAEFDINDDGGGVLPLHRRQVDPVATAASVECLRLLWWWWWWWWWWWCFDEDDGFLCRNDRILRLHRLNRLGDDDDPSESVAPPPPLPVSSVDDESDESLLLLLLPMPPLLLLLLDQNPVFTMFSLSSTSRFYGKNMLFKWVNTSRERNDSSPAAAGCNIRINTTAVVIITTAVGGNGNDKN